MKPRRNIKRSVNKKTKTVAEATQFTQFTIDRTADAAFWMRSDAQFIYVNEAACQSLGYSKEELLSMSVHDIDPCFPKGVWAEHWRDLKERNSFSFESKHKAKDGRIFPVELTVNYVEFEGKEYNCAFAKDITDRKRTEDSLKDSEEKYRSLVESTEDSIYLVDRDYKYLFINKNHLKRLGLSGEAYIGHLYSETHSIEETRLFIEKAERVFTSGESVQYEYKNFKNDRFFLLTISPLKKSDGTVTAVTVVSKDITTQKKMEEELRTLSLTDELTRLYNRRGFFTLAEQLLKVSKREDKRVFMLYADVDNLKEINDTFGHKEGDIALIEIAEVLKKTYRESDIVARIGGDEFVVISMGTTDAEIKGITSRLQNSFEIHNTEGIRKYNLSVSLGIAYFDPKQPCSIDELLIKADKDMYEQKQKKKQKKKSKS
jgi:diguanylate cyclase (GGDEF)-like protein/PAS domain S-box-containing protein